MADAIDGPAQKECSSCCEPIRPGASVCPHCGSSQVRNRWKLVGTALKWIGGTTALISFIFTLKQLDGLYSDWRDRAAAIDELVRASELQRSTGDYAGAWQLLGDALTLNPGSPQARDEQIALAMQWLRDIRVGGEDRFSDIVERLLPALARGVVNAQDPRRAADALAHMGWANYLRQRDGRAGLEVDALFARALEKDPGNPYAHAMWGFWILSRFNPEAGEGDDERQAHARAHFDAARREGREDAFVATLQLAALTDSTDNAADRELVRALNEMRVEKRDLTVGQQAILSRYFEHNAPWRRGSERSPLVARWLSAAPAADVVATFMWLSDAEAGQPASLATRFIVAMLAEDAGMTQDALAAYQAVAQAPTAAPALRGAAQDALARFMPAAAR
ncbi:MAG: zinc ribbon domain-containing protein [Rhodospirillales bacterium]|nr:zinc ribbon domain-containing protein [Rhodospirillales bacterium]